MKPFCTKREEMIPHVNVNKRIRVYRNLHRDCWSAKQGVVRFHTNGIVLRDVKFVVNEKIRQRVITNKRKEVHAYVEGILDLSFTGKVDIDGRIYYNPYTTEKFMMGDEPIESCDLCLMVHYGNEFMVMKGK